MCGFATKQEQGEWECQKCTGINEFAFATQYIAYLKRVRKWIMDLETTKHMTLHMAAFDTYNVISPHNKCLSGNSMADAIGRGCMAIEVEKKTQWMAFVW